MKVDDSINDNSEIKIPNFYDELKEVERGKYISKTLISPQRNIKCNIKVDL